VDQSRGPRKPQERPRRLAVVLVHGLWMRGISLLALKRRLEARGMRVETFNYRSVSHPLEENADALRAFVASVPGETVHLVGHSLGGVLIRALIEHGFPSRLGRIVCLGSPLAGSNRAARAIRLPGGRHVIGRSVADLLERGGFKDWAGADAASIAGNLPLGVGLLVGRFHEPNDGMVAVRETRLSGERDHIVLPVSHLALVWSARVAFQVDAFLAGGRFVRELSG
jgi:pimeloyl-ACP methyl ester carboxylesterase